MYRFLLQGTMRLLISRIFYYTTILIKEKKGINIVPENIYYYQKKKNTYYKYTKIINLILTIIQFSFYYIPIIGTIRLIADTIAFPINVIFTIYTTKNPKLAKELKTNLEISLNREKNSPEIELNELQKGEDLYHSITDALRIEGLNDQEIQEEIKKAKIHDPYLNKDNSKQIQECKLRINNLQLLEPIKEYLKNPSSAYKFTLKKKIQRVDINGNKLIIRVSKPQREEREDYCMEENFDNSPKMLKKSFDLKR